MGKVLREIWYTKYFYIPYAILLLTCSNLFCHIVQGPQIGRTLADGPY